MNAPRRAIVLACLAFASAAAAQETAAAPALPPARDRVLVCNKVEHTLSIFSAAERAELAVLPTGRGPHEVAVSPDGRLAVVSDYGDQQPGHSLTVVDLAAAKVLRTIELRQPDEADKFYLRPHGLQFVGPREVVVTSEATRCLLLVQVDGEHPGVTRTLRTPQATMHMVSVTTDGRRAAASSVRDGSVVFFDLDPAKAPVGAPAAIATGDGAEGLAVHPLSGDAWVGNRAADTLSVVSREKGEVVATLTTGKLPFRVAFTADGETALVTCADSGELLAIDAASREQRYCEALHADRSEQGWLPLGVVCDPDGVFAYVTCGRGEFVAVVTIADGQVVARMPARKGPDGIAYARLPEQPEAASGR
ncbi:MAG: YncE family protein [Planctomycetota bacterium]